MIDLSAVPLWAVFVGSFALFVVVAEVFRRIGTRVGAGGEEITAGLQGSTLGLLALMLGFTFALSLALFDARRTAVLTEANAIGTTALRARMLPEPERGESLKLLVEYTQIRVDGARAAVPDVASAVARSNAIQERLWVLAMQVAARDGAMVPTGLYVQTLNETIDDQAKRLAAIRNRVPPIVLQGLYGIALICMAVTGYGGGVRSRQARLPSIVIALLVAFVLSLIQDIDRPGAGFIRVSQRPMVDTLESVSGYLP